MSGCPSREQLERLLAEELHGGEREWVEGPVQTCAGCVCALQELTGSLHAGRSFPGPVTTPAPDGALADVLRRLGQEPPEAPTQAGPNGAQAAAAARRPALSGYEVLWELGRGAMGVVYKARDVKLNRIVALKMILAGDYAGAAELERFRTEAEAIARLQHPNIVQIYEIGEHAGLPYFTLEFVAGGSLDWQLAGTPQVPRAAARRVEVLARAMQAAHERGIVHRDLKPANVLVGPDGVLKVTDFGLAKKLGETVRTQPGTVMGTPSYMAPEQARGQSGTARHYSDRRPSAGSARSIQPPPRTRSPA
jgi:serine/threonine protein kinase